MLLHGGHGNWLHWARNMETLAKRYTVWMPDLPGYGDSSAPADRTLESMVALVRESLDRLVGPDTPVGLAGFSFGGQVAAGLAAERAAVSCLALLGPAGHGGERRPKGELCNWKPAFERGDWLEFDDAMRHNLMMHMLHDPCSLDATALAIHTQACLQTRFHSKRISRSAELRHLLDRYAGPLLLAWGEHNVTACPHVAASLLMQRHGHSKSVVIPRSGHWVQYEAANEVNSLLLDWFDTYLPPLEEI
ncbi:alpha/beta fold hydrolase [Acidovorax sp. 94]|uniref:alpha/beta fold hydrolase n=1 Tax=Acidovorax sp. 94 TaxID=2135633 RepID=UPI001F2964A9|nr:alpha/beta hydrolase [Acidovorax sp. 94]